MSHAILGPVADLVGGKRLLVVSDGALQYVPFSALPEPGSPNMPLMIQHEIVKLPSASVLAEIRRLKGKPQDGFLGLEDVYNMKLPVDLVVLSGCRTALGEEISGEGLMGLTRGFMYAGASRVVASLWSVDDFTTAELMTKFYERIEHDKMRPAAALRRAQIEIWRHRGWQPPYYWAAFELQGEWK